MLWPICRSAVPDHLVGHLRRDPWYIARTGGSWGFVAIRAVGSVTSSFRSGCAFGQRQERRARSAKIAPGARDAADRHDLVRRAVVRHFAPEGGHGVPRCTGWTSRIRWADRALGLCSFASCAAVAVPMNDPYLKEAFANEAPLTRLRPGPKGRRTTNAPGLRETSRRARHVQAGCRARGRTQLARSPGAAPRDDDALRRRGCRTGIMSLGKRTRSQRGRRPRAQDSTSGR